MYNVKWEKKYLHCCDEYINLAGPEQQMCWLWIQRFNQNQILFMWNVTESIWKLNKRIPKRFWFIFGNHIARRLQNAHAFSSSVRFHLLLHDILSCVRICAYASNIEWIEVVDGRCIDKLIIFGLNRMTSNEKIGYKVKRRTMKKVKRDASAERACTSLEYCHINAAIVLFAFETDRIGHGYGVITEQSQRH